MHVSEVRGHGAGEGSFHLVCSVKREGKGEEEEQQTPAGRLQVIVSVQWFISEGELPFSVWGGGQNVLFHGGMGVLSVYVPQFIIAADDDIIH